MAEIRKFLMFRHLRAEASSFVLHYSDGALRRSGRGQAFWFLPLSSSVAEVPMDDRELTLVIHGRTSDFQEVTAQGVLTYRVVEPQVIADRIDFGIDLQTGQFVDEPLEKLGLALGQLASQLAVGLVAQTEVRPLLQSGCDQLRACIEGGLRKDAGLAEMGIELVSVRIGSVKPSPDVERALEAPTREDIARDADEAAFARRASAVEKERAIAENELHNKIELAKKEERLIEQRGQNTRRAKTEEAEANRIEVEAKIESSRLRADARASEMRLIAEASAEAERVREQVRVEAERMRMEINRDLPPAVLYGLAARELATKLQTIEHLNISPELLGPMLSGLVRNASDRLGSGQGAT